LQVASNKISGSQIELSVEIPGEVWEKLLNEKYEYYRQNVRVDGFRRGKVSLGMVKKLYGGSIEAEALDEMVKEHYSEALEQAKIDPVAPGDVKDVDFGAGKPFTFKVIVEVMPELEIEGWDNLQTYLEEVTVEAGDVEAGMNMLREERAVISDWEDAIDHRSVVTTDVQETDRVGVPVLTHNWKDIAVEIGKNAFGPELDEQLLGRKAGEQVIVSFKTQADEKNEPKEVWYRFDIKEVKHKELPEMDDAFAQSIGENYQTIDDLRKGIEGVITQQSNSRSYVKMLNRLVQNLIENNRIDVPPSMLENYLEKLLENAKRDGEKINEDEFRKRYEPSAVRNLKWYILRKRLIEKNNLQAAQEEVDTVIEQAIGESGADVETMREYFKEEKNREKVIDDIEERKTLDFIRSQANISRRPVMYRDFLANNQ